MKTEEQGRTAVDLSQPFLAAGVSDPAALRYKEQLEQRRRAGVGLPAGPPIPLLTGEAVKGKTMAEQARPPARPPGSIFEPAPAAAAAAAAGRPAILPTDLLPDEATKDPAYLEGMGARYASAQPELAYKYGIIRNGQRLASQQLAPKQGGLSPATVEGLAAVDQFNRTRKGAESSDASVEADAAAGPAGAAARLGTPSTVETAAEKSFDDFDINRFKEAMMEDILNNDAQRQIIEARVTPVKLDDLIVNGYVTQVVPIIPGKFEVEFQDMTGESELALKRLIMEESRSIEISARYFLDKYSLMSLAHGVVAINKNPLPSSHNAKGFDVDLFWIKFNHVMKFNFHMLCSIGVHYFWFDVRVRKLFVAEKLGNG